MALKAGYYGIKKALESSIKSLVETMSGALIIKSLDDTMSLSDEGELSITLDNEVTENSDNPVTSGAVFSALENIGGGIDYSTTEQDTGLKWIDNKSIYCKTIHKSGTFTANLEEMANINFLYCTGTFKYTYQNDVFRAALGTFANAIANVYYNENSHYFVFGTTLDISRYSDLDVTVYYTKETV